MIWWKEYVLSIIGCVLLGQIIMPVFSNIRYKNLIQLIYGMFFAIVLLRPLSEAKIIDSIDFEIKSVLPQEYIDMGQQEAMKIRRQSIKDACESYISNKAKDLGVIINPEVYLDEVLDPQGAQIYAQVNSEQQRILEQILETDLGITKENQVWILNQEKDNS